ncbi:FtsX-like permease family protein [Cellulosimicrobium marinum]|uniref:FtsX-like permease family protein n=1 Tax=Cellulosimicrobium marinum TaxID=1638992 RepID=UPI001E3E250C|nr:FtsX-like permease family protein [Cellulosimicrobium marinum]MCB7137155.1 FtsX-like permease family protein [Cellulosimicrobium marinum]
MLRLTLAQMRRSTGRLAAAGVAVLIGTAFVAATLLAGGVLTRSTNDAIAARFADADLVVGGERSYTPLEVDDLAALDGVDAVEPVRSTSVALEVGRRTVYQMAVPTPSDPRFDPLDVVEGALPSAAGQVALPQDVAERLGVGVGDDVTNLRYVWSSDEDVEPQELRDTLTVVGITDDPYGAFAQMGGAAVVAPQDAEAWALEAGEDRSVAAVMVALADGADLEGVRAAVLDSAGEGGLVRTPDEYAQDLAAAHTGGEQVFTYVILAFAAVALVVAALVIANTFQVLVAQRTRTLALLRAVGANRGQLARSVLTEATILGLLSSLAGLLVGTGLVQLALTVGRGADLGVPLPATVSLTPAVVLAPLVVGTLVTVVASLAPARAATRVSPLEALRPADAPRVGTGAGRVRLVAAVLLTVVGFALLAGGVVLGANGAPDVGLLAGVVGGTVSFVGILVGAVFWLPAVVALVGRLLARTGPTARLAAANTLRNPRRTTATSTALLIGVTLVAMMSTGAASARTSLGAALDDQYPVDVVVLGSGVDGTVASSTTDLVEGVDGVARVAPTSEVYATLPDGSSPPITAVDPAEAAAVVRSSATLGVEGAFGPGTLVAPQDQLDVWGLSDGATTTLTTDAGTTLDVEVVGGASGVFLLTAADARTLDPDAATTGLWVSVDDPSDAEVVAGIQDAVSEADAPVEVVGAVVERAAMQSVVDTMLAVVVGLLAVAVVIALIGVANTLSLSVIERRRESATLRAIGLSRRRLRWMLAVEGMLIAGVGALLGVALGVVYGWAGAATALSLMGDVAFAVPWRDVAVVLVVALGAGLLASVVPGRAAARTSPVAALAVD